MRCKNDFLLYRANKMSLVLLRFSICLSFNSCRIHLPVFWIFSISRGRWETACWLTSNCSASCFCVCESYSCKNACYFICSHFFGGFSCSLSATSKSSFLKRQNHCSHVSCNGACSPWASRSDRCDLAAVFFKRKQKINAVREYSLFAINFDTLNTTTQHSVHTFPNYHSCATLVDDTIKWRSVKSSWHKLLSCAICCLKSAFHTCAPGIIVFDLEFIICIYFLHKLFFDSYSLTAD